jgi:gliding motility-associated-like protein
MTFLKSVLVLSIVFSSAFTFAQTADFSADVTSGCPPSLLVHFTDLSTGNPVSWNWNFGNGNTSTLQNPTAVYTSPGTYSVSLTVSGGNTKTKTDYIIVYQKPTVDFSVNKTTGCTPLSIEFTNNSTAGSGIINSYNWVFGDGGASDHPNPAHIYTTPSTYSVTLTVTNQYNCSSSLVKASSIIATGPSVNFAGDQTNFCLAPARVQFSNSTTGKNPLTHSWNFSDGSATSSEANPSHQFNSPGNFDVTLTTTDGDGCIAMQKKEAYISIGTDPGINFTVSAVKICVGQEISLQRIISVPIESFSWNFGNETGSTESDPKVMYATSGFYEISLDAKLLSGCVSRVSKRIEVIGYPKPNFKSEIFCDRKAVFTNQSLGGVTYLWEFGDGQISTLKDPVHFYGAGAKYLVTLTVYNALLCAEKIEKEITIIDNPEAGILPSMENACDEISLAGCAPFAIPFKDNSTSALPITSTLWTFGDNTNSPLSSPLHTYSLAGTYKVTLTVTNSANCKSTATVNVKVSSTKPTANFSIDKAVACVNDPITFTNTSLLGNFWCWDFGDKLTSNEKSPVHTYKKPGVYSVTLKAKNEGCEDIIIKKDIITIKDPYLEFSLEKECTHPYRVTMINKSSGFDDIAWDFGDGTTSKVVNNVPHQYQATGEYNIRLTIKSQLTGCTVTDVLKVIIQEVKSDFDVAANPACKDNPIVFKDKSSAAAQWDWTYGDGSSSSSPNGLNTFKDPGDYTVTLKVKDSDGCEARKSINLKVADLAAAFDLTATSDCEQFKVQFNDRSSAVPPIDTWNWEFGDGTNSTVQNPSHIYETQKSYPLRLTIRNAEASCSIFVNDAVTFTVPTTNFSASKTGLCVGENIAFTNASEFAQFFSWDFGNGTSSSQPSPTVSYTEAGQYTIQMKAKDVYGCEKSLSKIKYIEVSKPLATFEAFQTSAECPPLITSFKDNSSDASEWKWTFGDGQTSQVQNPTVTYEVPGVYDVVLEVKSKIGCTATKRVNGLVSIGGPSGDYSMVAPLCVDNTISFKAVTQNTSRFIWDFGDGNVADGGNDQVSHVYKKSGTINLSLTLEDLKGCKVVIGKGKKITIKENPIVDFQYGPEFPFEGEPIEFTTEQNQVMTYRWVFDDGEIIQEGDKVQKAFSTYGMHNAILSATDADGCVGYVNKDIKIQGDIKMIPNVFTPNSTDDFNEHFEIEDLEKSEWELKIFNRWGELCFKDELYVNQWDGGHFSAGVYYYQLTNKYRQSKNYKGYVQILK